MKKRNSIIISFMLIIAMVLMAGCSNNGQVDGNIDDSGGDKIKIVATIFPEYDWTREILGECISDVELTMLLDNGVDLHSYQATADDIITITESDLFIYVGGESDSWVDDVLKSSTNEDMRVINLIDVLGDNVKVEEMVEGMQETEHSHDHETDHDHDDEVNHDHDHGSEVEADEHVWLSLENAEIICEAIVSTLSEIDEANADTYRANADRYIKKLSDLDDKYENVIENARLNTILVADRFPLRYLVEDYDLEYYAAFIGCSAETEASFETITFLSNKVDELKLSNVLTIEGSDGKIANTVISNTKNKDQEILTINSMQSVTANDLQKDVTFISIMEDNLEVLKEALK